MPEQKENAPYPHKILPPPERMLREFIAEEVGWDKLIENIGRIEKDEGARALLHFLANISAIATEEFEKARDSIVTPDRLEKFLNEILDEKGGSRYDFMLYDAACLKRIAPDVFQGKLGGDFPIDIYTQLTAWLNAEKGYPEKYIFDLSNLKRLNPTLFELIVKPESPEWREEWKRFAFTILNEPHQIWENAQLYVALNETRPRDATEICVSPEIAEQFTNEIDELAQSERYLEMMQLIDDVRQIKIVAQVKPQTIH
jgi:hypothetical protein